MKKSIRIPLSASVLAALILCTAGARAVPVTYDFTATVSSLYEYDKSANKTINVTSSTLAGPTVAIGEVISGSFAYDTSWTHSSFPLTPAPISGTWVQYVAPSSVTAISYSVSGSILYDAAGFASVQIENDSKSAYGGPLDDFYLGTVGSNLATYYEDSGISLQDLTHTALSSDALPEALNLSDFQYKTLIGEWLRMSSGDQLHMGAALTSLTAVSTVPEAGKSSLFALGLGLLLLEWQRRRMIEAERA